ncbi:5-formyltetrahydrofolate cyclo-ligase [Streptomyces sp. H10-C2]|uniref:5-formyltetrahydrofolate cyclo-ligase n=1 Tax=unclassified Streptomyces TaxID=2593676 RepID=UPI0024BA2E74|nr:MULTISPECIES: 5-formyltetrahydrofolate cyclo-ligase [unclassified Streptomyces]MDJ0342365.1 5-formyltetrahydrofolate cyclo-ligase [Streptomyces sp. PH10-H1]MDJ0372220.1 5-formyltetrahydrofolate cyclo-ligase [Streptomyces sp. H10-C2]
MSDDQGTKAELRAELLRTRRGRTAQDREAAARALARQVADLPEVRAAGTVAAYVSMGGEPGTRELIEALRTAGTRVLLPVLMADNDLDWAEYEGPEALERTDRRLFEPTGARLGADAVVQARVVLLPGLAVDARGLRLGRGGGSYDRVLARLQRAGGDPSLMVLLYANEVVARVPKEPHDHPVHLAVTPEGIHRFTT